MRTNLLVCAVSRVGKEQRSCFWNMAQNRRLTAVPADAGMPPRFFWVAFGPARLHFALGPVLNEAQPQNLSRDIGLPLSCELPRLHVLLLVRVALGVPRF